MPETSERPALTTSSVISRSELVAALGTSRSSLERALGRGKIAPADKTTLGGHRRWSLALAARIVWANDDKVPATWTKALAGAT